MARLQARLCAFLCCIACVIQSSIATTACFYLGDCNGHGDCNTATYTCTCYEGWGAPTDIAIYKSPDCSLRTSLAVYYAVCGRERLLLCALCP